MPPIIVFSSCGSMKEANAIARDLVNRHFAACVNVGRVDSHYVWKGKLVSEKEYLMMIKSTSKSFAKLKRRIVALHSYELPEIIAVRIIDGHGPYLKWLQLQTRG